MASAMAPPPTDWGGGTSGVPGVHPSTAVQVLQRAGLRACLPTASCNHHSMLLLYPVFACSVVPGPVLLLAFLTGWRSRSRCLSCVPAELA